MFIYQPYFYIIQDTRNGIYYAGSKFGKDADPSMLLIKNGYLTSSKIINHIIENFGILTFEIKKIRCFGTAEAAYEYETKFLKKVDARKNTRFYNSHNNDGYMNAYKTKEYIFIKYGVENIFESKEIQEKIRKTNIERYGFESILQSPEFREKFRYSCLEKYGVENPMQSPEIQERARKTNIERYGVDYVAKSADIQEKTQKTNIERYGTNWSFQSEDIKDKIKNTNLERYGVENVSQSDEIRKRISKANIEKACRPVTQEIRKYTNKFKKVGLKRGWFNKNDEELYIILQKLKERFGEI